MCVFSKKWIIPIAFCVILLILNASFLLSITLSPYVGELESRGTNLWSIRFKNSTGYFQSDGIARIAVGLAITSKRVRDVNATNIEHKFQFFDVLLKSFCSTSSVDYHYGFFLAYDDNDAFFSSPSLKGHFTEAFIHLTKKHCPTMTTLTLVKCAHSASPAWAQNDAMMEAYKKGFEYFYRVNDDTILDTPGWTEHFIRTLSNYTPPLLGVVGPKHRQGNGDILTHDFVHRTHVDAFGFYYPRLFKDWWADGWITQVYKPGRSTKLEHVEVTHTLSKGYGKSRYNVSDSSVGRQLNHQIKLDRATIKRYVLKQMKRLRG